MAIRCTAVSEWKSLECVADIWKWNMIRFWLTVCCSV